jgi:hypothetical protein
MSAKHIVGLIGAFLGGCIVSGVVAWLAIIGPIGQGAALIYSSSLDDKASTALRLHRNEHEQVLKDIENGLPDYVIAVSEFKKPEMTTPALRKVKKFYAESGKPVPARIARILSSL